MKLVFGNRDERRKGQAALADARKLFACFDLCGVYPLLLPPTNLDGASAVAKPAHRRHPAPAHRFGELTDVEHVLPLAIGANAWRRDSPRIVVRTTPSVFVHPRLRVQNGLALGLRESLKFDDVDLRHASSPSRRTRQPCSSQRTIFSQRDLCDGSGTSLRS